MAYAQRVDGKRGTRYRGFYKDADGSYKSAGAYDDEDRALSVANAAEKRAAELIAGAVGGHDRIEHAVPRCAVLPVPGQHGDAARVACRLQDGGGPFGYLRVEVEGDDMALRAGDLGKESGVVARSADFQDPGARADARLGDHAGLEPRGADGRERDAVGILLGPHDIPVVALLKRRAGDRERVPGDRPEGPLDLRGADAAPSDELVGHHVAQTPGVAVAGFGRAGHDAPNLMGPRPSATHCQIAVTLIGGV